MQLTDIIKNYKFYHGDRSDADRLSVTEIFGGQPLQIALTRKHYDELDGKDITQATLGSIFDLGIKNMGYDADRMEKEHNGFTISGEPDFFEDGHLKDIKLTKKFALMMWEKNPKEHQYTLQLNAYRMMLEDKDKEVKSMSICWFLKDQSDVKDGDPPALVETEVPHIDDEYMLDKATEVHSDVRGMLDGRIEMTKCDDRWKNDFRCKHYCDVKKFCPYAIKRGYCKTTFGW